MNGPTQKIEDSTGVEIVVGTRVLYGAHLPNEDPVRYHATVTEIGEYDIDHDDDLGRARLFPPKVKILFDQGDGETAEVETAEAPSRLTWADYPDGPSQYAFVAEDLEVLP